MLSCDRGEKEGGKREGSFECCWICMMWYGVDRMWYGVNRMWYGVNRMWCWKKHEGRRLGTVR